MLIVIGTVFFDKILYSIWYFLFDFKYVPDFEVRYDAQNNLKQEKNDNYNMNLEGMKFLEKDNFYKDIDQFNQSVSGGDDDDEFEMD